MLCGTLVALLCLGSPAAEGRVAIRADFPGGNVRVVKNEGGVVRLAPDLRGGQPWFYWHLEAEAERAGEVSFVFDRPPMLGVRGPAASMDGGKTWRWLGAGRASFAPPPGKDKAARQDSFTFTFTEAKQKVRFAVAIPYLQRDLDVFLARHKANPHLAQGVLAKTRLGRRPVELLQVGKPGPGVRAMLLTARHHACESMASYVMEGFLQEAISDSPAGAAFRKGHVLYAVPFVDKDGVEAGDQGKNRLPHDHNRDYGKAPLYPEIQAIQDLAELRKVRFALDLHCPFLRGDVHEAFHFLGLGVPVVKDNLREWIAWIDEERPRVAMKPLDYLVDPDKPKAEDRRINSHWFATREGAVFAATLEIPYAQRDCPLDADLARAYGASMLRAWVRTKFVAAAGEARGADAHAGLAAFRDSFLKAYRSKPKEAEALAASRLDDKETPALYRAEANGLMALLRFQQRRPAEALRFNDAVRADANGTASQRAAAAVLRVQILSGDPASKPMEVANALEESLRLAYLARAQRAKLHEAVGDFLHGRKDYEGALIAARKQLADAAPYEEGRLLIRTAALHDLLRRPAEAVAARKEAVKILRARLGPVPPRSIFGAMMAGDLFEALADIPTSTPAEKRAAGDAVLKHEIASATMKAKVRKALAELGKE